MLKIVEFEEYCFKCKYRGKSENDKPCCDCISVPAREDSKRPEKYKEDEKWTTTDTILAGVEKWKKEHLNVKGKKK